MIYRQLLIRVFDSIATAEATLLTDAALLA
jgi:hypothetical protein